MKYGPSEGAPAKTDRRPEAVPQRSGRRFSRALGTALAVLLFGGAVWVLQRELRDLRITDLYDHLRTLSVLRVGAALLAGVAAYVVLTGYDVLGWMYAGRRWRYPRLAFTSFIAFALSMNLGFPLVTGTAVRYRLYTPLGFGPLDLTRLVAILAVTYWLGFLLLGGVALLRTPGMLVQAAHLPTEWVYGLALLFLLIVAVYVGWCFAKRPLRYRQWEFRAPQPALLLGQVAVGCGD